MGGWMRRIRGAIGMGLTWAAAWFSAGMALLLVVGFGAADVPFRFALIGNAGMLVHLLPTVYFGAAAAHLTRMAGDGHGAWEIEGLLLMLGLGVCVALTLQVTRRAWAAIDASSA